MKYSSSVVSIHLLGEFELLINGKPFGNAIRKNKKLKQLLENIILHRDNPLSQEDLILHLWGAGSSENPTNALKNLVYRLRKSLSTLDDGEHQDYIILKNGTYCWNSNITCLVDVEHFDDLLTTMEKCLEEDNRLQLGMEALDIYNGDLFAEDQHLCWAAEISSNYRKKYLYCFNEIMEILYKRHQFEKLINYAKKAIDIDPLEEIPHHYQIYALLANGEENKAMDCFKEVVDLFFREKGEKPSDTFMGLYYHITSCAGLKNNDLLSIIRELSAEDEQQGSYYCDMGTFKTIFQLMRRFAARNNDDLFLGMITIVSQTDEEIPNQKLYCYSQELKDIICEFLRRNDGVTKLSANQYLLSLVSRSFDDCLKVMDRLKKRYKNKYPYRKIQLNTSLLPVEAFIEENEPLEFDEEEDMGDQLI